MRFKDYRDGQLRDDPGFAREYAALESERAATIALVRAREEEGMTLADLSKATGIGKANICRIENGTANPTLKTLARLAAGLGRRLEIKLV